MRTKTTKRFALKILRLNILLIVAAVPVISAPDICVRSEELKVPIVYGRVVYSWKGSKEEFIPHATIEIRQEVNDELQKIAEASADDAGYFHIKDIRPGKYEIYVSANNFRSWSTRLKVVKSSKSQKIEKQIVIILEPLLPGACGDARVERVKSK